MVISIEIVSKEYSIAITKKLISMQYHAKNVT